MEVLICQSCGMPMGNEEVLGTNSDGSKNQDYCIHCYKDGVFTNNHTMDEMIEINIMYIDEFNKDSPVKYTPEEAREELKKYLPTLKRWKKD